MKTEPNGCPTFPHFGASYPDACCIDGYLWDKLKDFVDENGFFFGDINLLDDDFFDKTFTVDLTGDFSNRPKELKFLELNNGWISIHSEEDLPKEKTIFEFIPCNRKEESFIGWIDSELQEVFFVDFKYYKTQKIGINNFTHVNSWLPSQITHFRELKNYDDKKPIY